MDFLVVSKTLQQPITILLNFLLLNMSGISIFLSNELFLGAFYSLSEYENFFSLSKFLKRPEKNVNSKV